MTPNTPDDADVLVTRSGQISPGCPTAGAVLDGYSEWQRAWSPVPTLSERASFAPTIPPSPTRNPWTFLRPGSFILFQLDKRELANQLLVPEDSDLLDRCLALPTKSYAGLVLGSFGGESDSDVQEYVIAFLSKSLPPGSGTSMTRDSFTVPIDPTERWNTNRRPPLCPKPFSWTGCYQYTVLGTRIAPTRIYHSAIEYGLDENNFHRFETFAMSDRAKLDRQAYDMSFISDEEASLFEGMRISDTATSLPVKVWQELTAEKECHDPREFLQEASEFRELAWAGVGEFDH